MNGTVRVGPAGGCEAFSQKYGDILMMPDFLLEYGLNAYEYQCGRGVRIGKNFGELREKADAADIEISLHAPYYISLSSVDEQKRVNSVRYIRESAEAVSLLGGKRIVVHSGSCSKMSRADAVALAVDTLKMSRRELDEKGFEDVIICPETLGKLNQLGTVPEVCELCGIDERMIPCLDFGHINSMTGGSLKTSADFEKILDIVENALGSWRMRNMHIHFSKIEYTLTGGEVRHLTFADRTFGPEFPPLAELIVRKNMTPFIICESAGTQTADAAEIMGDLEKASGILRKEENANDKH